MLFSRAEADSVTINKLDPGFNPTHTTSSFIWKQRQSWADQSTWLGGFEMRRKARGESRRAGRDPAPTALTADWKGRRAASTRSLLRLRRVSVESACGDEKTSKTTASVPQTICVSSHIYFITVQHGECVWTCCPWTQPFQLGPQAGHRRGCSGLQLRPWSGVQGV